MRLIEWEVAEDGYEEQIIIPKEKRELAAEEGISAENKQKVTARIMNLKTGESYIGRLAITGNHQIYVPTEIQEMLKESGLPAIAHSCPVSSWRVCSETQRSLFWHGNQA